jgi:ParB family chromosome partitioning protein
VVRQIEEKLRRKLQTGVSIQLTAKDKGEVRIAFFSNDDLERLLEVLGIALD